ESPADAARNDPASPINLFSWLEKLFVGMTTGGPPNPALLVPPGGSSFSKSFPSLWAYRPGDDAFDTNTAYLSPYTGIIQTQVACAANRTGTLTIGSRTITAVADTSGIAVGMLVSGTGIPPFSRISAITPSGSGGPGTITWSTLTGPATAAGG